jgi:hypothetical protein
MCPPLSDNGFSKGQHATVDPIVRRARNVAWAVSAAPESVHSTVLDLPPQCVGDGFGRSALNAETMMAFGVDQLGNGGRTPVRQVEGEHVTQLDTSKARQIHCRTFARRCDTNRDCR